jgi:hypothetical protein
MTENLLWLDQGLLLDCDLVKVSACLRSYEPTPQYGNEAHNWSHWSLSEKD